MFTTLNCTICPLKDISNTTAASFTLTLHNMDYNPTYINDAIILDTSSITATTTADALNHRVISFSTDLSFMAGVNHTLSTKQYIQNKSTTALIELCTTLGSLQIYSISSSTFIFTPVVTPICENKTIDVTLTFAKGISMGTNIIITLPSYAKFQPQVEGPCSVYIGGLNAKTSINCKAENTSMILFDIFNSTTKANSNISISFRLTNFLCVSIGEAEQITFAAYNIFTTAPMKIRDVIKYSIVISSVSPDTIICNDTTYSLNGTCVACPTDCATCVNSNQCNTCKANAYIKNGNSCVTNCGDGFYATNNMSCTECTSPCANCIGSTSCISCIEGYATNGTACTLCPDGNYVLDSRCYACMTNCVLCTSNVTCSECNIGYFVDNDLCTPCSTNCTDCASLSDCTACVSGTYNILSACVSCDPKCTNCENETYCTECASSYILSNGECMCPSYYCKDNCPLSDTGCSICYGKYYYDKTANLCNMCKTTELLRNSLNFTFNICTGSFGDNNYSTIGYTGNGNSSQNNICSIGTDYAGAIPTGFYRITNITCKIGARGSPRVMALQAINRFSYDTLYDMYFTNLSIYSESSGMAEAGTDGYSGIVLPIDFISQLTIGDLIEVSSSDCQDQLKNCTVYPPPSVGSIAISYSKLALNEFRMNFINWGYSSINISQFSYSVQLNYSNNIIELCSSLANITDEGILCNENNKLKLGHFNSGKLYSAKFRAKYAIIGSRVGGIWSELKTIITIANATDTENATAALSQDINATNTTDLLIILTYRQQALDSLIPRPVPVVDADICPTSFCQNGGVCYISNQKTRCRCTSNYSGVTCSIPSALLTIAVKQNEQASEKLLKLARTADASLVVKAISTYSSNTDTISTDTVTNSLSALDFAINSSTSSLIDETLLTDVVTNVVTAFVKNAISYKEGSRRSLYTTNDKLNYAKRMQDLRVVQRAMKAIVQKKAHPIVTSTTPSRMSMEGQMNIIYYSSTIGNATLDGVNISSSSKSIITVSVYPWEVSRMYPVPENETFYEYVLASNVVSFTTQSTTTPNPEVPSDKSVIFLKSNLQKRILADAANTKIMCGYVESEVFTTADCTSHVNNGDVECMCSTVNSNIYVVYSVTLQDKITLIIYITVPLAIVLMLAAVLIPVIIKIKGRLKILRKSAYRETKIDPPKNQILEKDFPIKDYYKVM